MTVKEDKILFSWALYESDFINVLENKFKGKLKFRNDWWELHKENIIKQFSKDFSQFNQPYEPLIELAIIQEIKNTDDFSDMVKTKANDKRR